jgi:hypothetical protein
MRNLANFISYTTFASDLKSDEIFVSTDRDLCHRASRLKAPRPRRFCGGGHC